MKFYYDKIFIILAYVKIMGKKEAKRTVSIFAAASFLNDLGSDIVYPIWPLFVTTFLGANLVILGLLDGLGDGLVSISQAASGYISDRIKRRKIFIWLGYLLGSLSRIGYGLSTVWQILVPFKILDRTGKMRDSPRDAVIADASTKNDKGKNFGIIRMFDNLGAVAGIVISITLLGYLGYKKLFLLASIPSIIAALLVYFFIREKPSSKLKVYKGISFKNLSKNFKLFLVSSSFFALGAFSYSFLLVSANKLGFRVGLVPVLYLVFTAVASLFTYYFGKMSDRTGRKFVLSLSYIFWIITCIIFIYFESYILIIFAFVFYGLHRAALEPVQKAFVAELAPAKFRASTLGGFQMVFGLLALPASLLAGFLWTAKSMTSIFYFSIFLTLVSIIVLFFVKEVE